MASLNLSYKDFSDETTRMKIQADEPADGTAYDALVAAQTAMLAAINALTNGALQQTYLQVEVNNVGEALPTNPYAQRELKWFVPYRFGTPGNPEGNFTIPVANLVGAGSLPLVLAGTDLADMSRAEWVTFKAQIESGIWGVTGTGNYVIGQPYLVGRNI